MSTTAGQSPKSAAPELRSSRCSPHSGAPRTSAFKSPDWPNTREFVADRLRRVVLSPENEHGHADRVWAARIKLQAQAEEARAATVDEGSPRRAARGELDTRGDAFGTGLLDRAHTGQALFASATDSACRPNRQFTNHGGSLC